MRGSRRPMRPARFPLPVLSCAAALLLSACASSEADYYTLKPWPGAAARGGPSSLELRTPSVPSSLDRDYIVRSDRQYKLKLDGSAAWSEPLADMIAQTLASDLQQRLPDTTVYTESGSISAAPAVTLEFDVSQFADDGSGDAVVAGTVSLRPANGHAALLTEPVRVTAPMSGKGVDALVPALSVALGRLADRVAADARRLPSIPAPGGGIAPLPSTPPVPLTAPPPVPFGSR